MTKNQLFTALAGVELTPEQNMVCRKAKTLNTCPVMVRYAMMENVNKHPLGFTCKKERHIEFYWLKNTKNKRLRGFLAVQKNGQWTISYQGIDGYSIRNENGKDIMKWETKEYKSVSTPRMSFDIPKVVHNKHDVDNVLENILKITGIYNQFKPETI